MDALTDHLFLTIGGTEARLRYEAMINRQLNHAIAELENCRRGGSKRQWSESKLRNKAKKYLSFNSVLVTRRSKANWLW